MLQAPTARERDRMVKLIGTAYKRDDFTTEEFFRYWREVHGPLVRRHAATLRIRRYVQVHTLDDPLQDELRASRGGPEAYDGVAELWWDRREDLDGHPSHAHALTRLTELDRAGEQRRRRAGVLGVRVPGPAGELARRH